MSPENLLEEIYLIRCAITVSRIIKRRKESTRMAARKNECELAQREERILSEFLAEWKGQSEKELRQMFDWARKKLWKKETREWDREWKDKFYCLTTEDIVKMARKRQ